MPLFFLTSLVQTSDSSGESISVIATHTPDTSGDQPQLGRNSLRLFVYAATSLLLFILLFGPVYAHLFEEWQAEDFTYCWFVPLVVFYLLWEKRPVLRTVPSIPSWWGLSPLLAGIALYWLGELGGEFYVIYIGSWLVFIGFVWNYTGWRKLKTAAFPLLFLLAMFPFPRFITNNLTLRLKLVSSKLGVVMMQWYGLAAYREGNIIDLGFTRLQVVDACSGLRFFFPLIVLSILLAYYFKASWWRRLALVVSAIPVSIVTNGMRITSVGILYQFFGPAAAEGFFHDFSGWFIFMLSLGLLLLEMWVLTKTLSRRGTAPLDWPGNPTAPIAAVVSSGNQSLSIQFVVAAVALAVSITLSHRVDFHEKVPLARPLGEFPLKISTWRGERTAMEKIYLDELKFDDYVMVNYADASGKTISFYTAYFGSQAKGGSIHSPASCLPGGGWVFEESGDVAVPLGNGAGSVRVRRAYMQKGGVRGLTYFWFPQHGRVLTDLFQLKLYTFWNALTCRRTDGALVRIITPVYDSEKVADAEARLQGFVRELTPVLAAFMPK